MSNKHDKAGGKSEQEHQEEDVQLAELQTDEPSDEEAGALSPEEVALESLTLAQTEIADLKDKLLRAHAETDNVRKRARRDIDDARKFGVERFATELLVVVDNLERALDSEHDNAKALQDGVQLTLEAWHGLMKKFDIERVDAVGEKLDPHIHEAIAHLPNDAEASTVIDQHLPGYTLHGRLLRAAMVVVSSGPADEEDAEAEQAK